MGIYIFVFFFLLIESLIHWFVWGAFVLYIPIFIIAVKDFFQKEDNVKKNYPFLGSINKFLEKQRHVIQEILLQKSWEGRPFSILQINYVKKKSKEELQSIAFGSEMDFIDEDYYWIEHSLFPLRQIDEKFRIDIGSSLCTKPYNSSIFNVGAMSFGSISSAAVSALCEGAKKEGFAVNTGEGGISEYHWNSGCDLIWQIGTGYFGCRDEDGNFNKELFKEQASKSNVKMIELKISQGAKPGFGAILPASKNTEEIAKIRNIDASVEVHSPGHHSAFSNAKELLDFIGELRELSGGKPVGIKFCLGSRDEIQELFELMVSTGSFPDFIVVEGGEGGSGAADLDSVHHVGAPLHVGLDFIVRKLAASGLDKEIKIISTGKIVTSTDLALNLKSGADACYSARGMMFALGCVQSLKCNTNKCPTGITTMNPARVKGLVVEDKAQKVANYHRNLLEGLTNIYKAAGIDNLSCRENIKISKIRKG